MPARCTACLLVLLLAACGAEETDSTTDADAADVTGGTDADASDDASDDAPRTDAAPATDPPTRPAHTVEELLPDHGALAGEEQIGVIGHGYARDCSVWFGVNEALSVAFVNDRALDARTPPGDSPGPVDVTVVCGPNSATLADGFTYEVELVAEVDGFEPLFGQAAGGDLVTFTGRNLIAGERNLVRFGGDFGSGLEFVDTETLTVVTPEVPAGRASVSVELGEQRIDLDEPYVFLDPLRIAGHEPFALDRAGGTVVTFHGSGLVDFAGINVRFEGEHADPETFEFADDGMSMTLVAPPSEARGPIVVQVGSLLEGTAIADGFAYVDPVTVTGIEPDAVPTVGVNRVTILGSSFDGAIEPQQVFVGDEEAFDVSFDSDTEISFLSPPIDAGRHEVTLMHGFEFVAVPEPLDVFDPISVEELSVDRGPEAGGTRVDVTGSGFVDGVIVRFGTELGLDVAVDGSGALLSVTTPAVAADTGTVDVTVQSPFSAATLEGAFTFEP